MSTSEDLDLQLERLEAHDGDLFLLHFPTDVDADQMHEWASRLRAWLETQGRVDVRFICTPKDVTVERLSAEDLERVGLTWLR